MGNEIETGITSIIEATLIARKIARNNRGKEWVVDKRLILPCDLPNGKSPSCQFRNSDLDLTGGILCQHPDKLGQENNGVTCPLQKGGLRIVNGES